MKNSLTSSVQQPMIVKYVEALHNGIQSQALSRYAIGYILRGTKYIYDGDKRQTLSRGDVFYLGIGHHYIENFPEGGQPFEQVLSEDIDKAALERGIPGRTVRDAKRELGDALKSKIVEGRKKVFWME